MAEEFSPVDPELELLRLNKQDGFNYRERRHADWATNYTLYRDKVTVNRLTQRQAVNLPLMKQTVRTLLKDVDDMPLIYFESLDNDKQKEIFLNEYWKWTLEQNNMSIQDIVDKRQVFLFGRSFTQFQVAFGKIKISTCDPQDMLVSRYLMPYDLQSSRFLIHTHIFVPLSALEEDEQMDKEEIKKLKKWYATKQGLVKVSDNEQMFIEKNQKMADMGMQDVDSPVLGETYVELALHFIYRKEDGDDEEQLYLYVEAEDRHILSKRRLEEVIGTTKDHFWRNHFPYDSWADDVELQDFWSDAVADIVRTPNVVLNTMFSQLVEHRTLRSFGMNYYNSTNESFQPQTFNPQPWGWYPIPGNPDEMIKRVEIPDLTEAIDEMGFIINMTEKATGATATQQGVAAAKQVTLGEVKLALTEAKERIKGMSKFYTPAWARRGQLFLKMVEAAGDKLDAVTIAKKGKNSNDLYPREVSAKDWTNKVGYLTRVWGQEEKNTEDMNTLQKINAVKQTMPDNPKLTEIYQRKMLEFASFTPDEINEVLQFEKDKMQMIIDQQQMMTGGGQMMLPGQGQMVPPTPQMAPQEQLPMQ